VRGSNVKEKAMNGTWGLGRGVSFAIVIVIVGTAFGCNGSGPGPTRETCSQLGWVCGTDDFGNDCGTCSTGSCAHGTCTTGPGGPTTHALGSGATDLWAAGTSYAKGPYVFPVTATVSYSVSTTTGDTFDVSVMDAANWSVYSSGGSGVEAYALHNNTSIASDSAVVPAGTYYLAFHCENLVERCLVTSYTISATY